MFHIPILQGSYTNKNDLGERKLKYKLLIELNQQYNKLYKNDPAVANTTIISNAPESSGNNVCSNDPLTPDDSDDNMETKFYHDYIKPQKTYERWFDVSKTSVSKSGKRLRKPFQKRHINYKNYSNIVDKTRKRLNLNSGHYSHRQLNLVNEMVNGHIKLDDKVHSSVHDQHIKNLINLLYHNIFQCNWNVSYKIFAILIRLPRVDIKSIWHLGCKILSNCIDKVTLLDYLNWLHSFYSSKKNFIQNRNYRNDPVFREGSRTHTPQFSVTWIWENLIDCYDNMDKIDQLVDKVNELLLLPPFMDDSQVWFILSMCHFCKANCISEELTQMTSDHSKDNIDVEYRRNQLETFLQTSITQVNVNLQKCQDLEIPRDYIQRQLQHMEIRHNEFVVEETSFLQQLDREDTSFDVHDNALFLDEAYDQDRRGSVPSSE